MTARGVHHELCSFQYRSWGGKRAGAGRPRRPGAKLRHAGRPVLQNARRHADAGRGVFDREWIDPRSSGRWFDGWRGRAAPEGAADAVTSAPRTWLLAEGWRRHGSICVDEVPAGRVRRR